MIWLLSVSFSFIYLKVGYIDFLIIYVDTTIAGITLVTAYNRIYKFLNAHSQTMKRINKTTSTQGKLMEARKNHRKEKLQQFFCGFWFYF